MVRRWFDVGWGTSRKVLILGYSCTQRFSRRKCLLLVAYTQLRPDQRGHLRIRVNLRCTKQQKDINALWEIDKEASQIDDRTVSLDYKRVLQVWEDNLQMVDTKFEIPIRR